MSFQSVSKTDVILESKDIKVQFELKRHLSPRTVGSIIRALPISGRAHIGGAGMLYIETTIQSGIERSRREFQRGDVAFLPANGTVVFFAADSKPGRALSIIGHITHNIDALKDIKLGDMLSLYRQ